MTLTGTGGCGKTQLALQVAAGLVDAFPDGVWLVELAPLQAPHLVPYAVAAVLGRRERAGEALIDTLVAYLKARELLLVLDNCEHLIDACADLAERLLAGCPRVRLLATSRERLRIGAETTWRVPSLPAPDPRATLAPADLLAYPAVRLFVERAQAVQPDFALESGSAASSGWHLRPPGGLPLALELAAARVVGAFVGADPGAARRQFSAAGGRRAGPLQPASRRSERRWTGVTACSRTRSRPSSDGWRCSPAAGAWKRPRQSALIRQCPSRCARTPQPPGGQVAGGRAADERTGDRATACWSPSVSTLGSNW